MAEETTPQAGTTDAGQAPADDQFDADRAKALIDKLRPFEKQAKQLERELADLRQAEEQRKRAEMTELDKLKADLDAERQARTAAEQQRTQQLLRSQVIAAAARMGLNDPEDAVRMLDTSEMTVADDGAVDGLDEALKALVKAKPYLVKSMSGTISPTNPAGGPQRPTDEQLRQELFQGRSKPALFEGGGVYMPQ